MENNDSNSPNSPNSPKQPGQDGETSVTSHDAPRARERKPQRRAIDAHIIAQIAELCVCQMLTEAQACRKIGVNPQVWRNFKSRNRNSERWEEIIESLQGDRISDLVGRIDDAAAGRNRRESDWRAACYLLQLQGKRFIPDAPAPEPPRMPPININLITSVLEKVYATVGSAKPAQLAFGPVKALPAPPSEAAPVSEQGGKP